MDVGLSGASREHEDTTLTTSSTSYLPPAIQDSLYCSDTVECLVFDSVGVPAL
jgi:hypothetical protein